MLKEITIENFKSINKEQLFSMEACPESEISEFPDHIIHLGNTRLLKVGSMYGPNGGGKSNLLEGIRLLKSIIKGIPIKSSSPNDNTYLSSLFNDDTISKFVLSFETIDYEIKYELFVDISKSIKKESIKLITPDINYESLVILDKRKDQIKCIFKRDNKGLVSSESLKDIDLIKSKRALSTSTTFIAYIITTFGNSGKIEDIYNPLFLFADEIDSIFILQREPLPYNFDEITTNKVLNKKEKIINSLNRLDIRIKDLTFKFNPVTGLYDLYIIRTTKDNKSTSLPLSRESNGTMKIIALLFDILFYQGNRIYLADDLDAYLHPKLISSIIELFNDSENNNKQLLMNSHDVVNMNNKVFRRDEIWFAYRDEDYQTIYNPLSNIYDHEGKQIRKDARFGKQYLEGRYGGDPFIGEALNWEDK